MNNENNGTPIEILLVEDDPGDVGLTHEVMEKSKIKVNINVVDDGVKALEYLRNMGEYADVVRPDLILLDLNLPKKDGREVLEEIKNDNDLKYIPVVILTTSDADEDIIKTYNLGCSCYINKTIGLEQFTKVVHTIEEFWFTIVKLPPRR